MSDFDIAVEYVLKNEGELVNNPNDPGGITKYGISLRFLKSLSTEKSRSYFIYNALEEDILNLTRDQAKLIYKGEFWNHASFNKIKDQDCTNYIFDMAVNMGINPSIKCAQRACWSVIKKREIIEDDGILGEKTIFMINECSKQLLPAMRSERAGYYRIIADEKDHKYFLNGWLNRAYE